jgi:hypothetical protein
VNANATVIKNNLDHGKYIHLIQKRNKYMDSVNYFGTFRFQRNFIQINDEEVLK